MNMDLAELRSLAGLQEQKTWRSSKIAYFRSLHRLEQNVFRIAHETDFTAKQIREWEE